MTKEELKDRLNKFLAVLRLLASLTASRLDDDIVEFFRYQVQDTESVDRIWDFIQKRQGESQTMPPAQT